MSDAESLARYNVSPEQAFARLSDGAREAWRAKYVVQDVSEARALVLLGKAEAALRSSGKETTIRTLWMLLADRAGRDADPDLKAAAALAASALGLISG